MTDREELYLFRLNQAAETVTEAEKMLDGGFSSRSIVNRAYYAMFYAVLALFLRFEIPCRTSKHAGVISVFDREVVRPGRMDPRFSRMLHGLFDLRQKADYKEFVAIDQQEAVKAVEQSREFVEVVASECNRPESP